MSGLSTLEKLAQYYKTKVKLHEKLARRFVEIKGKKGTYFVIDNSSLEQDTLLVASNKHNDYVKIKNDYKAFGIIADAIETVPKDRVSPVIGKKLISLFGQHYAID
ncbi:hypothetical protein VV99796_01615 [Vibrio vulnificus]|uniref:hypothetical protein n=1 Tax=Vibrio vulnificus TaxID=672 RepID=UPI00092B91E1|nr:hypothetical protein [Vibrio vulnificus]EHT4942422.1 hypothetical protein [Vibrio vulnificus]EID4342678.1 hypothetical protein [Vibrio vulnificus]OJI28159.1 hypothetical protein VV99796_01615 [Vibrio vulnificus]OJI49773.1 hypothetical protein VVS316_01431 [Vibrio vulnificus]POB03274.1 hypothetical protein CRN33_19225 [Vibrio vulnificus]